MKTIAFPTVAQLHGRHAGRRHEVLVPGPRSQRRRLRTVQQRRQCGASHRARCARRPGGDAGQRHRQAELDGPAEQRWGRRSTSTSCSVYVPGTGWKTIASPTIPQLHGRLALTNGTNYSFRIRAHNAAGFGPDSSVAVRRGASHRARCAPPGLVATPGNGTVKLTWKAPASNGRVDDQEVRRAEVQQRPGQVGETRLPDHPPATRSAC